MSSGRSLPQINLGVQGGNQGDSHKCKSRSLGGSLNSVSQPLLMEFNTCRLTQYLRVSQVPGKGKPSEMSRSKNLDNMIDDPVDTQPSHSN
ncbi:hypothetical protein TNCV_3342961 [Trichonephila clavipes]|nr:hypothetical protein TNCV_3342961 [Trichonephila clavipes]